MNNEPYVNYIFFKHTLNTLLDCYIKTNQENDGAIDTNLLLKSAIDIIINKNNVDVCNLYYDKCQYKLQLDKSERIIIQLKNENKNLKNKLVSKLEAQKETFKNKGRFIIKNTLKDGLYDAYKFFLE